MTFLITSGRGPGLFFGVEGNVAAPLPEARSQREKASHQKVNVCGSM